MVRVSPSARKSKLLSAALNVVVIDPEKPVLSLLAEVASADASTVLRPLGSVPPPDQVIEARLALTELSFKSVKLRVAEGAVSNWVFQVVWGISVIARGPASAASTGGGGLSWATSTNPELPAVILMVTGCGAASLFAGGLKLIGWT